MSWAFPNPAATSTTSSDSAVAIGVRQRDHAVRSALRDEEDAVGRDIHEPWSREALGEDDAP